MRKRTSVGRIFRRTYRDRNGELQKTSTWFLKYRVGDKSLVIPAGTDDYAEADRMLKRKLAAAEQQHSSDENCRVSLNQLLDIVIEDYRSKARHSTYDVEHRIAKHLRPFFGTRKPFEITATLLNEYIRSRTASAAPATVNKELAYLKRAFRLGYRHDPPFIEEVPMIPQLTATNSQILDHDDAMPEQLNAESLRRLEQHIQAKTQVVSESDAVLDNNGQSL